MQTVNSVAPCREYIGNLTTCFRMAPQRHRPIMGNITSSTQPGVHNIFQCRRSRTKLQPRITCTENLVKFGHVVFEICGWADGHAYRNTSHAYREWSKCKSDHVVYVDSQVLSSEWLKSDVFSRHLEMGSNGSVVRLSSELFQTRGTATPVITDNDVMHWWSVEFWYRHIRSCQDR